MDTSDGFASSEGLGLSLLVYLGAVFGALALLAMPVYYAVRPEVHPNPVMAKSDPLLKGTVITDRLAVRFPLERLQKQNLAEAEPVIAKPKVAKKEPASRVASRPARRDNVAELRTAPDRTASAFPFSLF